MSMKTPVSSIDVSDAAATYVRQILALPEDTPLTLDLVLDHAILGQPADVSYLKQQTRDQTLAGLRETYLELIRSKAELVNRVTLTADSGHTPDDCAQVILGLCPLEVSAMRMQIAREHTGLPDAEIIASVLIANWDRLHAGDVTQLQARSHLAQSRGAWQPPRAALDAPATCEECRRSFKPKRVGQRYGCDHCGELPWSRQKEGLKQTEAMERRQEVYLPQPFPWDPHQCTCGLTETTAPAGQPVGVAQVA